MGRWIFDRPPAADVAVACLLTAPVLAASIGESRHGTPIGYAGHALAVAATLALALRRRQPLATLGAVTLCTFAYLMAGYAYGPILIVFMLAVYSATRHAPLRAALWSAGGTLGLMLVHLFAVDRPLGWLGVVPVAAWTVVPGTAGYGLRLRHEARQRALRDQVDEERLRVAQEVHDIVGHGLAAIKMQADIALHVMARQPGHAEVALQAISRTSQQALDELRATLDVVRRNGGPESPDGLQRLSRRMADAGVDVRLDITGDRAATAAADLAVYRIVQESLTNVLRHGGCGSAGVTVRYEPSGVTVTVTNPWTGGSPSGTGSGITGMRARAEALGGQLTAGPAGQQFEVRARLPIGGPR